MADDITLTVRARNLTRGEFDRLGQQLRGMNRDMRRVGGESDMSSAAVQRFGDNIRGVSRRMNELRRTGNMGRHELTHMRRTMGILNGELRHAHRTGGLTRDQFRDLSNQLQRTRLDFDQLTRDVERHDAVQQRVARARQQRERERARAAAQQARADAAAQRVAARAAAQQARAQARAAAQAQAHMASRQRQLLGNTDNVNITQRFRGLGNDDHARMTAGINRMSTALNGVSTSSTRLRRNIGMMNDDLGAMSRAMHDMRESGIATRRDLQLLANGLQLASRNTRDLRRSGDLTRAQFRSMTNDITALRSQLHLLGGDGTVFDRMSARLRIMQARLRDTNNSNRGIRRAGDMGLGGLIRGVAAAAMLAAVLGRVKGLLMANKRWAMIFIAALVLIGPIAQALGAVLVAALGGAFIALGAFALKGNAQVKASFTDMKNSVSATVREAAQPMKDDLVAGIEQVGAAMQAMGPQLSGAFAAAGPLIEDFFGGFTDFAGASLPGFTTAMEHSKEAMGGFREAMAMLGQGFGEMMRIITVGNEDVLADAWRVLGNELRNLLVSLGEFMSTALNSGTATTLLIGVFRTFTLILNVVAGALKTLDVAFGDFFGNFLKGATDIDRMSGGLSGFASSFEEMGKPLPDLKKDLAAVTKQIETLEAAKPKGPAGDIFENKDGASLADLKTKEAALSAAVKAATLAEADAHAANAKSIHDVIDAMTTLNQQQISRFDAQAQVEAAIDNATEQGGKLKNALKVVNGEIVNMTEGPAQQAWGLLSQIAGGINRSTEASEKAKVPLQQMNAEFAASKQAFIEAASGMAGGEAAARSLAEQVLRIPGKTLITVEMVKDQARADLAAFNEQVRATPNAKEITLTALGAEAQKVLETVGYKVTHLPDGTVVVTTQNSQSLSAIAATEHYLRALNGRRAVTYVVTRRTVEDIPGLPYNPYKSAMGGPIGFASGGRVLGFPDGGAVYGPGTNMSDSISAMLSNGEFVMRAAAVDKYGTNFMQALNRGLIDKPMGFAKGGKVSNAVKAERKARNEARGSFGISHFGRMAGYKNPPFRKELADADSLGDLVGSLNKWRSIIKKATHGGVERNLLKRLNDAGRSLIKHQNKLAKVNSALDKAKDKLTGLKDAAKQMSEGVRDGIKSQANVTSLASGDKRLTLSAIVGGLTASRDKSSALAGAMKTLKGRGLSKEIIAQIGEAGIDGGLETATALLSASSSEISTINAMQSQIGKAATAAGKTASDAMFGAGIKAAEGLVKGLTKDKKKIEDAMMKIAKSMEKAIKKALGIKSPSKVMEKVGHYTAEGFAVGMQKNKRTGNAWDSMLNVPRSSGGAGGGRVVIELRSSGTPQDEFLLQLLRKAIRVRGGDVQVVLGK